MSRTGLVLTLANATVIAAWLILWAIWFDGGGLGCDQFDVSDYGTCSDRADTLVALGLAAVTLFAGTLVTLAVQGAGRLRAKRAVR